MSTIDLGDHGVLLREDVLDDPRAFQETLRREAPVWRIPRQDTHVVPRPTLVREVVRRTDDRLPPHVAFGRGIHFDSRALAARMGSGVVLERVLSSTTSIRLDPDRPPTRRPSIFMRRHRTLHLEIDPA